MQGRSKVPGLVFAGSVLWIKKIQRTELNWSMVQSIFQLWLPKFGVILVACCLISKVIQNHSKTSWNWLQPVKQSCSVKSKVRSWSEESHEFEDVWQNVVFFKCFWLHLYYNSHTLVAHCKSYITPQSCTSHTIVISQSLICLGSIWVRK